MLLLLMYLLGRKKAKGYWDEKHFSYSLSYVTDMETWGLIYNFHSIQLDFACSIKSLP